MKHETFMTITGSVAYEVPATNKSEARELHTTNSLLSNWRILDYLYDGVDCGKTGSTPEAGYCLVSSCLRDGKRLVAVVLAPRARGLISRAFPRAHGSMTTATTTSASSWWSPRRTYSASRWPCPRRRTA